MSGDYMSLINCRVINCLVMKCPYTTPFTRWSEHEANLEHTSCTCILNTFDSHMFPRVNGVLVIGGEEGSCNCPTDRGKFSTGQIMDAQKILTLPLNVF